MALPHPRNTVLVLESLSHEPWWHTSPTLQYWRTKSLLCGIRPQLVPETTHLSVRLAASMWQGFQLDRAPMGSWHMGTHVLTSVP